MSSRIAKSTIDWAKFASVVPKAEQVSYNAFKARSDAYLTRVLSYPENPPQINFEDYKNKVKSKDVVAQLEKAYKAVKIPYPKDTLSQEVDKQEQEFKAQSESYVAVANAKIAEADKLRAKFEVMIPYKDMSMEDFVLTFPDWVYTTNNPSVWPHPEKTPGLTKEQREQLHKPDGPPYSC